MYKGKKFLAVIPARGGSKRLPNKNILDLGGKPLVQWTIDAAENSKYIDEIIFTSDSDTILNSVKTTRTTKQKRDPKLAQDDSKSLDVVFDSLDYYGKDDIDYVMTLQPTSPLRNEKHIDDAIEQMFEKGADSIIGVCECEHSPLWANTIGDDDNMDEFTPKHLHNTRSQDLPPYFRINGALYITLLSRLKEEQTSSLKDKVFAYRMSQEDSIDIDNKLDFIIAQAVIDQSSS